MSQASRYLDALTHTIGPRPASSDTERQASEWLQAEFTEAGIAAELQDFDAPRSPKTARTLSYLVVPVGVFGIGAAFLEPMWVIHWASWLMLSAIAVLSFLDLYGPKGPAGLVSLLPKGPSQNVIAKSIPSSYSPGEMPKKVVLLAHYDTELATPLSGEATFGIYRTLQGIANTIVLAMPILVLSILINFVFLRTITAWIFYALLVLCIPGVILVINQLVASLMNRYSPGANNNASGVAALLATMEKLDESQQGHSGHTMTTAAVKLAAAEAKAAEAARQSSKMPGIDYKPAGTTPSMSGSLRSTDVNDSPSFKGRGEARMEREEPTTSFEDSESPLMTASFESVGVIVDKNPQAGFTEDTLFSKGAETEDAPRPPQIEQAQTEGSEDRVVEAADRTLQDEPSKMSEPQRPLESLREDSSVDKDRFVDFETVEFSALSDDNKISLGSSYAALEDYDAQATFADEAAPPELGTDMLAADVIGAPLDEELSNKRAPREKKQKAPRAAREARAPRAKKEARGLTADKPKKKRSFFAFGKKNDAHYEDDPSNWLGLDDDFNARKEGKAIGSWDNFSGDGGADEGVVDLTDSFAPLGGAETNNEDDNFSWKGGFAGDDPIEDAAYASAEAARIRRKVIDSLDVELTEKEVWFVATGAHYAERAGVRAFMDDYGDELRGALFINLSAVGAGDLYWSTKESFGKNYQSSARLTSMLRRLVRESGTPAKAWKKTLKSDAGPILAANRKAITLTRLTEKGVPFALASQQDTAARLDAHKIDEVADLVCDIIREAN